MFAGFRKITSHSAEETGEMARRLALALISGDVLLLSGGVGTGKSHFARQLILALLDAPEDVPSPTFTLVQTYRSTVGEIWHADLYRLGAVSEIEELGLPDAFETAIVLVEWPDRLGPLTPPGALNINFALSRVSDDQRNLTLTFEDRKWSGKLDALNNA